MERMELNPHQIRSLISEYSAGLEKSFIERRCHSHKEDILEELSEVIQELNTREKQVKSLAGITQELLDNNEALSHKLELTRDKKLSQSETARVLKLDIESIKKQFFNSEEKIKNMEMELSETEKQVSALKTENKRLENRLQNTNVPKSTQQNSAKEDLIIQLKQEVKDTQKTCKLSEKQSKELSEKLEKVEKDYKHSFIFTEKLERENQKLIEKIERIGRENLSFQDEIRNGKEEMKRISHLYQKTLNKMKSLEEELYMAEHLSTKTNENHGESYSLMNELQMIHSGEFAQFSNLNVENSGSVNILRTRNGQFDLCEEYFILTTQSIKMCSPHMDAICTIPTKDLYNKATALGIPFHKWHDWINHQLESIYIRNLYRCK